MIRAAVAPLLRCRAGPRRPVRRRRSSARSGAKEAKKLVNQKGLTVSRENPNVAIGVTSVIQDKNGIAAVVELRNTGKAAQAGLP